MSSLYEDSQNQLYSRQKYQKENIILILNSDKSPTIELPNI